MRAAGYAPEVVKVYGFRALPDLTRGRREVRLLTGSSVVPVLVLDDGQIVKDSKDIAAWAQAR
jgi:glutathione S-transferase